MHVTPVFILQGQFLFPDWFATEDQYEAPTNSHGGGGGIASKRLYPDIAAARLSCYNELVHRGDILSDIAQRDSILEVSSELRLELAVMLLDETRSKIANMFEPTCFQRECRDSKNAVGDRQGMNPLTRDDPYWEEGVYQSWFSYSDDYRAWEDTFRFMDLHGWIDEGTTEVMTSMILYSPRMDVFSKSDVKFMIDGEGQVATQLSTHVVSMSDKRIKEGHWFWDEDKKENTFKKYGGKWSFFPAWMGLWAALTMLTVVWELTSVLLKSTVERVAPDDPDTPEIDEEFFCRSSSCPWILENVLLNEGLQRVNRDIWPNPGLFDGDPHACLGKKIKIPCSIKRVLTCIIGRGRLVHYLLFATFAAAEYYWQKTMLVTAEKDEKCLGDPMHRSWPGCFKISVHPNPDPENGAEVIMDTMQGLIELREDYTMYRTYMTGSLFLLFFMTLKEMDCIHHIDTFVIMFKLALKPSAIFIVFFAFVFVCFGLTIYLLLGDAMQSFSSLPNCLIVSAGVLTGEYPFLDDAESMDGQDQLLLLMWFWIFMIVTVFIMLNVFITIIGEAYEKAKQIDLAQSTLSYHWLSFLCFPLMIFRMKYVIAAINELMTSGEVQIGTGGCKKKSPQKYDNVISVQMPSGQVDGEWQGGTTLHSDMLRLVDDKFGEFCFPVLLDVRWSYDRLPNMCYHFDTVVTSVLVALPAVQAAWSVSPGLSRHCGAHSFSQSPHPSARCANSYCPSKKYLCQNDSMSISATTGGAWWNPRTWTKMKRISPALRKCMPKFLKTTPYTSGILT